MSLKRYKENPFAQGMVIPVKGKQVQLSPIGKDDNVLINQATGDAHGTHVTTYKKVDSEQFVKIFPQQIGAIFELKASGIKALGFLIWLVKDKSNINKDQVLIDDYTREVFLETSEGADVKLSSPTLKRGLNELENAKIIAKTIRKGFYYINPNFIFNGNRIAFTSIIERSDNLDEEQVEMILN